MMVEENQENHNGTNFYMYFLKSGFDGEKLAHILRKD